MQESKIDEVVNKMIDAATDKGDGFVLGLLKNAENEYGEADGFSRIEVRASRIEPDEFQRIADGRNHIISDVKSFIDYTKKYGDPDKSLIFYNQDGASLTIDEFVDRGEREIVSIAFEKSDEWKMWNLLLTKLLTHRDLNKALVKLTHTIIKPEILLAMRKMKMNVQVVHDSDLQEDDRTIGVLVKSSKGEDLKKFPKQFDIRLPFLDQDVTDKDAWIDATIHLNIELPDDPTKPCTFDFNCHEWNALMRDRVLKDGQLIRDELSDFTIIHGYHKTFQRKVGTTENGLMR